MQAEVSHRIGTNCWWQLICSLQRCSELGASFLPSELSAGRLSPNCDEGESNQRRLRDEDVAALLKVSMRKLDRVKKRFVEAGMDAALGGRPSRRHYKRKADGDLEAHEVALSCSEPPAGNAGFVAAMERVLDVYRCPYDRLHSVVCMDEAPDSPSGKHARRCPWTPDVRHATATSMNDAAPATSSWPMSSWPERG